MIYTVTLNPAVDREYSVAAIEYDTVLRASASRADCGGKGFNVSRMVAQLGDESVALGFAGGRSGEFLRDELTKRNIATDFVWIDGETRTNTSIVTANGHYVKVNERGAAVSPEQEQALIDKVRSLAKAGDWWVLAGSLPQGISAEIYKTLITILNAANANVILDANGDALAHGCTASPTLIKPNEHEAEQLTGLANPLDAAHALQAKGVANVIVSLGADGAYLVEANQSIRFTPPAIEERNPIGAGDAMVGGVVWALNSGKSLSESVRWGIACGSVAASLSGTAFGEREQVEAMLAELPS